MEGYVETAMTIQFCKSSIFLDHLNIICSRMTQSVSQSVSQSNLPPSSLSVLQKLKSVFW